MISTNEEFCNEWFANLLGRKVQHGFYYNQKFKNAEFLCYFNQNDSGREGPFVIAMRCLKTGLIIVDNRNITSAAPSGFKGRWRTFGSMARYTASFSAINAKADDLAEITAIDHVNKLTPCGRLPLVLYDVNGYRFYTDQGYSAYAQSRQEFLDYSSLDKLTEGTILDMALYPVPADCKGIMEARETILPSNAEDLKVLGNVFLDPSRDFDPSIPDHIFTTAKWKPCEIGFPVPADTINESDGKFDYNWRYNLSDKPEFLREAKETFSGTELENLLKFGDAHFRWKEAVDFLVERRDINVSGMECHLNYETDDAVSDIKGNSFLRGNILRKEVEGQKQSTINLGDIWHRVTSRRQVNE